MNLVESTLIYDCITGLKLLLVNNMGYFFAQLRDFILFTDFIRNISAASNGPGKKSFNVLNHSLFARLEV